MKKMKYLLMAITMSVLLVAFGGCASGVATEDFEGQIASLNAQIETLNTKLVESEQQVNRLSSISAYQLWFDQFYSLGTYSFPDVKTFNKSCGQYISKMNDADSVVAWNLYIQADKDYYDLLNTLSKDTSTWTKAEYEDWAEKNEARSDSLGQVGATLFKAVSY